MNYSIPTQINILGLTYSVNEVEVVNKYEPLKGQIDYIKDEILIDKTLNSDAKMQTFIHEVLHGILEGLGLYELNENETLVQSLSTALHQVQSAFKEDKNG